MTQSAARLDSPVGHVARMVRHVRAALGRVTRRSPEAVGPNVRLRRVLGALSVGLMLALPTAAHAQSLRGQGVWVPDHVFGGVIGLEVRQPLGAAPPLPGAGPGPVVAGTRDWIITGMVGAGLNVLGIRQSNLKPIVYVHGGLLHRTGSDVVSRAGLIGVGYFPAKAVGPELLLELAGVADVQAGVLHVPGGWKPAIGATITLRFLKDVLH